MPLSEVLIATCTYILYLGARTITNCILPLLFVVTNEPYDTYWWCWYATTLALMGAYYLIQLPHLPCATHARVWQWFRDVYFPLSYHGYMEPPPPLAPGPSSLVETPIYFYAAFPHGLWAMASTCGILLNPKQFGHVHSVCASQLFWIPLIRSLAQISGAGHASRENIKSKLDAGRNVLLVPEGMSAFTHLDERAAGTMHILRRHKGFCRVITSSRNARRIQVIPVFTPGEWNVYRGIFPFPSLQRWMISKFGYAGPFITLGWHNTWLPDRVPLNLHFGQPVHVLDKTADALHEEICDVMEKFMKEIKD